MPGRETGTTRTVDVSGASAAFVRDWRLRRIFALGSPFAFLGGFAGVGACLSLVASSTAVLLLADVAGGVAAVLLLRHLALVRFASGTPPPRLALAADPRVGGRGIFAVVISSIVLWAFGIMVMLSLGIFLFIVHPVACLLFSVLWLWCLIWFTKVVAAWVRRLFALPATEAATRDGRRPVVHLRGFDVTPLRLRGARRSFGLNHKGSFESVVMDRLWRVGPVLSTARPLSHAKNGEAFIDEAGTLVYRTPGGRIDRLGVDIGSFGGPRHRLPSTDWQTSLDAWLCAAQCIVVVVGHSPGLAWELDRVRTHELARRLVLVIPPDLPRRARWEPQAERRRRLSSAWDQVTAALFDPRVTMPQSVDLATARVVLPGIGDPPVVITSGGQGAADYSAALDEALRIQAAHVTLGVQ